MTPNNNGGNSALVQITVALIGAAALVVAAWISGFRYGESRGEQQASATAVAQQAPTPTTFDRPPPPTHSADAAPTSPVLPVASQPATGGGNLTPCTAFQSGETRDVSHGTFVIGDIIIDGIAQYDSGGIGEGTVAYFEKKGTVTAQWGAGCYLGSRDLVNEVVDGEFQHGCGSKCTSVRLVLVQSNGQQQVQYFP